MFQITMSHFITVQYDATINTFIVQVNLQESTHKCNGVITKIKKLNFQELQNIRGF